MSILDPRIYISILFLLVLIIFTYYILRVGWLRYNYIKDVFLIQEQILIVITRIFRGTEASKHLTIRFQEPQLLRKTGFYHLLGGVGCVALAIFWLIGMVMHLI